MNKLRIDGLDGTSPIGFLAVLGLIRLMETHDPSVLLGWQDTGGTWHPRMAGESIDPTIEWLAQRVSQQLIQLGEESTPSGHGAQHLGDKIGVPRETFREYAINHIHALMHGQSEQNWSAGSPRLAVDMLSAFASDILTDQAGAVQYSPLSFSNGASGQLLLKDFRNAARLCTSAQIVGTLRGTPTKHAITSLNWDPQDQRAAAHRWRNPAVEISEVDPGINALAFVGMSWFVAVPTDRLTALGWRDSGERGLVWPLWTHYIDRRTIHSLLTHALNAESLTSVGVAEVRFSAVINPDGKRNYFAPSRRER